MATPEDMRVDAEHVRLADQFVEVAGGGNHNNYANVQLILQIAERAGVDAVWPGWWENLIVRTILKEMLPRDGIAPVGGGGGGVGGGLEWSWSCCSLLI